MTVAQYLEEIMSGPEYDARGADRMHKYQDQRSKITLLAWWKKRNSQWLFADLRLPWSSRGAPRSCMEEHGGHA